jgi:thiamine-phosphate pyrophosphorylase
LARSLKRPEAARDLPRLLLMTDSDRLPDPVAVAARLPRGISGVVYRDYGRPDREKHGRMLRDFCRARGIRFLVAGDMALAIRLRADGLHLPEFLVGRLGGKGPLRRPRPGFIVTAAVHGEGAARRATHLGVDALVASPVFATASHPGARVLGIRGLQRIAGATARPVFALGGLDGTTAARLRVLRLAGFAGISGL